MTQSLTRAFLRCLVVIATSAVFLTFVIHGLAQQASPRDRQKTFETVWKTINDKYFDPSFGGVDWTAVKKQYEPQLAGVQSDLEFRDLLDRMLKEIRISHLRILDLNTLDKDLARSVVTRPRLKGYRQSGRDNTHH
jgi:hypothetical protein